jgi:hypothetical protein
MYCIQNPAIDLHNHFWVKDRPARFSSQRKDLNTVLESMKRAGIDICALTSDKDYRYERVVEEALKERKREIECFENCVVVDSKVIFRGEEVYTDKGSIVLVGLKKTIWQPRKTRQLVEALKIGKSRKAFILVPHPFLSMGGVKEAIEETIRYADAIEISPYCSKQVNKGVRDFSREKGLPAVCTSDARHPRETGRGFFVSLGEFEFKDGEEAVQKLKECVRNGMENYQRPANLFEIARYLVLSGMAK